MTLNRYVGVADGGRQDAFPTLWFMESLLSLLRMHWDHEPTPNPSQEGNGQDADGCLLPSREGSGVGRFMERILRTLRAHGAHGTDMGPTRAVKVGGFSQRLARHAAGIRKAATAHGSLRPSKGSKIRRENACSAHGFSTVNR